MRAALSFLSYTATRVGTQGDTGFRPFTTEKPYEKSQWIGCRNLKYGYFDKMVKLYFTCYLPIGPGDSGKDEPSLLHFN